MTERLLTHIHSNWTHEVDAKDKVIAAENNFLDHLFFFEALGSGAAILRKARYSSTTRKSRWSHFRDDRYLGPQSGFIYKTTEDIRYHRNLPLVDRDIDKYQFLADISAHMLCDKSVLVKPNHISSREVLLTPRTLETIAANVIRYRQLVTFSDIPVPEDFWEKPA